MRLGDRAARSRKVNPQRFSEYTGTLVRIDGDRATIVNDAGNHHEVCASQLIVRER